ncbi:MAG: hypothetical protein QN174_09750 [Armatimonadota bacterium]|nr:hypothetical protein [Armatimonadota bacterium]MDR7423603.1 hypothetical protein [Armatimonadota bacterium]MDR7453360.1 hypothetical protein [Armatimonadota bacterium]MDR7457046.1 hypothetical protein [Armatimonadota bacterium]MDR7497228.1 hypothetical protein [Armatimonadota bacterium]
MTLVGLALAVLVFWSLGAVGAFLIVYCGRRAWESRARRDVVSAAVNTAAVLLGAVLAGAGIYATVVVLRGR